jgi:L-asparaginase / beta-aspartyl-peptidase
MKKLIFFILVLSTFALGCETTTSKNANETKQHEFGLVIHGGAGTILKEEMTEEQEAEYRAKLEEALKVGYAILEKGGTSMDAVVATVKILEDSPLFNAGKGAVFTNAGTNELDASIMDGATMKAGAVGGVTIVRNPITAARAVLEKSEHVMLTGEGANQFAILQGLDTVDNSYFYTQHRFEALQKAKNNPTGSTKLLSKENDYKFGTVGAAALDKHGNLAAATSTGGMTNKKYGRIGDSPIIGAGTYANNNTCAVSCTGHGEFFIRYAVAHDISAMMEYKGVSLQDASNEVVNVKLKKVEGSGGVIAIDKNGNIAMPFNTEGMYRGFIHPDGKAQVFIYKD